VSGCPYCDAASASGDGGAATAKPSLSRKCFKAVGWVAPGVTLALIPKCPVCFAAYFALGTGVALSTSTATYLRWGLIAVCAAALAFLVVRSAVRFGFRGRRERTDE
jgi:hypothetical protein